MTDTAELVARLEEATEGSRRLSDDCLLATGWTFKQYEQRRRKVPYDWVTPDGKGIVEWGHQPDVTRDLADAIEWLVPPFTTHHLKLERFSDGWYADIWPLDGAAAKFSGWQKPSALAVCIAALRARASNGER